MYLPFVYDEFQFTDAWLMLSPVLLRGMRSWNSPVSPVSNVWRPKMDLNVKGTAWAESSRNEIPVRVGWKTDERSLVATPASRVRASKSQEFRFLAQITRVDVEILCFVGEWKHTLQRFSESELACWYLIERPVLSSS